MTYIKMNRLAQLNANTNLRKKLSALNLNRCQSEIHTDVLKQARISYQASFQPEFLCCLKPDFSFIFVNDAFTSFYKQKPTDIIGQSLFSILPNLYHAQARTILSSLNREKAILTCEYMFNDRDDKIRWRQWTTRAVFNEKEEIIEYQCIGRDITEQKEAEEQLLYRLAIEEAVARVSKLLIGREDPDIDDVLNIMGQVLAANRAYIFELRDNGRKMVNTYEWCDSSTEPLIEYLQNQDVKQFAWGLSQLSNNRIIVIPDITYLPPEAHREIKIMQQQGIFSVLIVPICSTEGELIGYIGLNNTEKCRSWHGEDIQCLRVVGEMLGAFWERKKAEATLTASEEKFRTLADTAPAIIFVWTQLEDDSPLVYLNSTFEAITGLKKSDYLHTNIWNLVHPDYREMTRKRGIARLQGALVPDHYELRFMKQDGAGWGDMSVSTISWEGKPAVMGIVYDISERKKIEEELWAAQDELEMRVRERTAELVILNEHLEQEISERKQIEQELIRSENNFRKLAENSPALIYVFNKDCLLYANSTALSFAGYNYEEIAYLDPIEFIHPDLQEQVHRAIISRCHGEAVQPYETKLVSRNGQEIVGYLSADIIDYEGQEAVLGVVVDVTEHKKMEEELIQASKLESLGILAGGIAHDFNNILTIISGNISLAKMLMEPGHELNELLLEVDQATLQAKDLTQQLLTFSKGGAPIKEAASIQELIKESAGFILRGSNVNCKYTIPDDLWTVIIDKGQINQVINNLIINADQAMPDGGTIQLSAENICVNCKHTLFDQDNYFIKISIVDQGVGIAEDQLSKIFDPYYTTKQKGHGLGLPTCYSIIKKHGGDIKINSELGLGTTVDIFLPANPDLIVEQKNSNKIPLSGQGRILLMDDDVMVRETLGKMLTYLGYQAVLAADGFEAIELYAQSKSSGQPCDAVIMDLTIAGGMGGKEAVRKLLELDCQARVIVSSGYSNDPVMADFEQYGFCGVIPKPYEIERLNEVLFNVVMGNH